MAGGSTWQRHVTAGISASVRYEILRRDRYTCRFCGMTAEDAVLHVDHVIPRRLGGSDSPENLQVLCEECNLGKSMTMPERWLIRETAKRQRAWKSGRLAETAPDDLASMYAYMDACTFLEGQPTELVLCAIMHICGDVYPYRPTGGELICAAEGYIRSGKVDPAEAPF